MQVEFPTIMHVSLRFTPSEFVGYAQEAWQIKLPLIQFPSPKLISINFLWF